VNYLEANQAGQLQAIGAKLSQARAEKGISLEEIAAKTFIPLRLLTAIEAGKLELLPEPIFVQGFIRRFAAEVGLDGPTLAKEFAVAPPIAVVEVVQESPAVEGEIPAEWPTWFPLLGAGLVLATLVGIAVAFNRPQPSEMSAQVKSSPPASSKPGTMPKTAASEVAASKLPESSSTASPRPIASSSPSPIANPTLIGTSTVEVKLNLIEESWVSIETDGKLAYEGTLPKGSEKILTAQQNIVVNTGNAGGVAASFNGSALKPLGEIGTVTSVSYPPANESAN
jgi:cytoskeleton protein RodZ